MVGADLARAAVLVPIALAGLTGHLTIWALVLASFALETASPAASFLYLPGYGLFALGGSLWAAMGGAALAGLAAPPLRHGLRPFPQRLSACRPMALRRRRRRMHAWPASSGFRSRSPGRAAG